MPQKLNSPIQKPLLEICVDNAAGLEAAIAGGADRIELCSALSLGGLTPSRGFMALAAMAPLPVQALIRPRAGNFVHGASDLTIMKADIEAARAAGLSGVVIGASASDGALDRNALEALVRAADGMDLTLHRVFDLTPNPLQAMEVAISLGFRRILTSGGRRTALEGKETLKDLIHAAAGRISIMPGSGIRVENAAALLGDLAVSEVHASCSVVRDDMNPRLIAMGFAAPEERQTAAGLVAALKSAISRR